MVPAGIGDDTAAALLRRKGSDLVISAAQLESADGLQVLGLEIKEAIIVRAVELMKMGLQQSGANGDAVQSCLRLSNVVNGNDTGSPGLKPI